MDGASWSHDGIDRPGRHPPIEYPDSVSLSPPHFCSPPSFLPSLKSRRPSPRSGNIRKQSTGHRHKLPLHTERKERPRDTRLFPREEEEEEGASPSVFLLGLQLCFFFSFTLVVGRSGRSGPRLGIRSHCADDGRRLCCASL